MKVLFPLMAQARAVGRKTDGPGSRTLRELLYATLLNDSERAGGTGRALHELAEARRFLARSRLGYTLPGLENHQTWGRPLLDDRDPATENLCRPLP